MASGSRPYSTIFRYSVPRLMSRISAACFLFQLTFSSTWLIWARSASRSDGIRSRGSTGGASEAWRNSMSEPRMIRSGEDSAARETVLSSSRMLPGQCYLSSRSVASFEKSLPSSGRPLLAQ